MPSDTPKSESSTPKTKTPSSAPPAAPQGQPQPPVEGYVENPGQTFGIIGIVLNAMGITIGGIILGVLSRNKSKQANMSTTLGTISLVWGIIGTVLSVLIFVGAALFMLLIGASGGFDIGSQPTTPSNYDMPSRWQ